MNPTASALSAMNSRARSSPRCSTSVASSPWRRRRGSTLMALLRGRRRGLVPGARRQLGLLVVAAADRVLELAHALAERAPDLREALWPEHEQRDDEDHDEPGDSYLGKHGRSVASSGAGMGRVVAKEPLSEQVLIVTGASSGFGRAIARLPAKAARQQPRRRARPPRGRRCRPTSLRYAPRRPWRAWAFRRPSAW